MVPLQNECSEIYVQLLYHIFWTNPVTKDSYSTENE